MKNKTKRKIKKVNPYENLPMMTDGGLIMTPKPLSSTYTPSLSGLQPIQQSSTSPASPSLDGGSSGGFNTLGFVSGLIGQAGNIARTDWNDANSVGNAVEGVVETVLPFVPVVGQVASIVNQVTGPVGSAIADNSPTDPFAMGFGKAFDYIGTLSEGIGEISQGNWKQGALDILAPVAGGVLKSFENKHLEQERKDLNRTNTINNAVRANQLDNPSLVTKPLVAKYGGPVGNPSFNQKSIHVYNVGGKHNENPNKGTPVDANANPSANTGAPSVALVEQGEVAVGNHIFTDSIYTDGTIKKIGGSGRMMRKGGPLRTPSSFIEFARNRDEYPAVPRIGEPDPNFIPQPGTAEYVPVEGMAATMMLPVTPTIAGIGKIGNMAVDALNPLSGMKGVIKPKVNDFVKSTELAAASRAKTEMAHNAFIDPIRDAVKYIKNVDADQLEKNVNEYMTMREQAKPVIESIRKDIYGDDVSWFNSIASGDAEKMDIFEGRIQDAIDRGEIPDFKTFYKEKGLLEHQKHIMNYDLIARPEQVVYPNAKLGFETKNKKGPIKAMDFEAPYLNPYSRITSGKTNGSFADEVMAGEDFSKSWYAHPASEARYNMTPGGPAYSEIKGTRVNKTRVAGEEELAKMNKNKEFSNPSGLYDPATNTPYVNASTNNPYMVSTHENTHPFMTPSRMAKYKGMIDDTFNFGKMKLTKAEREHISKPEELNAKVMESRAALGMSPDDKFTAMHYTKLLEKARSSGDQFIEQMIMHSDPRKFIKLMNTLSAVAGAVAGVKAINQQPEYEEIGGHKFSTSLSPKKK